MHLPSFAMRGFFALSILLLVSCSPAPRHELSEDEKIADLYWLFSKFQENYAPMAYKEDRHKITFKKLKESYLDEAKRTKTNEEFYSLLHRFVAEFKDAHTASSLMRSSLPSRVKKAYLGFDGARAGEALEVTELLPTIASSSRYPLKVGDRITKLNGVSLKELVLKEAVKARHLGHDEANLTYHMPRIFSRQSLAYPIPDDQDARLTVMRKKASSGEYVEINVTLPWVVKDLHAFTKEQNEAAAKTKTSIRGLEAEAFFQTALKCLSGNTDCSPEVIRRISNQYPGYKVWDRFVFVDTMPTWSSPIVTRAVLAAAGKPQTPMDELAANRKVPGGAIFVKGSKIFPTYVTAHKTTVKKKPVTRYVATMYLNTFSPDAGTESEAVEEVRSTLEFLGGFGVKHLLIDMIDNGGGSLKLGLRLAQILSAKKIVLPEMQFKTSETWMDHFEEVSLDGPSDAEREIGRRVFEELVRERKKGGALSRPWSVESLFPYVVKENDGLKDQELDIVLLVNEMCASMCDIFTGILKDNKLATVIGTKTMGAGGNVTMHREAPNSHLVVNQTESLVLRRDGSYVENNGVDPDVVVEGASAIDKYSAIREKAIEVILKEK